MATLAEVIRALDALYARHRGAPWLRGLGVRLDELGYGLELRAPHPVRVKYQPDYPDRFASLTHGRAWCQEFFGWYNDDHQHPGLALFTPADVVYGRVEEVASRQVALDAAYAAHPERFPNGPPVARRPPASVAINPLSLEEAAPEASAAPLAAAITSHEVVAPPATSSRLRRPDRSHPAGEIRNSQRYAIPS